MFDLIVVLVVLTAAVGLFLSERLAPAMVSMLIMVTLMVTGVVSAADGLAGFANEATVAVAGMLVLSRGFERAGAVDWLGRGLAGRLKQSPRLAWVTLLASAGLLSGFVNNTAVVAVLIPILIESCRKTDVSPTKLLLPVSFAAMFGGTTTLIGTSTNLLVTSVAEQYGEQPIAMFDLTAMGLVFFALGLVYLLVIERFVPERRGAQEELTDSFGMGDYLTNLELVPGARAIGQEAGGASLIEDLDCEILDVLRDGESLGAPPKQLALEEGDVLQVRCDIEDIERIQKTERFRIQWHDIHDDEVEAETTTLVEAAIVPYTELDGHSLADVTFRERFNAVPLAVRQRGHLQHNRLDRIELRGGDILLLEVAEGNVEQVREADTFMLLSQVEKQGGSRLGIPWVAAVLVAVVLLAAAGVMSIAVSVLAGCVTLVLTRIMTFEDAIDAIDWNVVFLMAGVLSLGVALETSGAAELLASGFVAVADWWGPVGLVSAVYITTALLTSVMSNQATAAVLVPIAIAAASTLEISARPLIMAIAFAASASFMTPLGYQTNTMVYGAGHYRFRDFVVLGGPLTLIFWIAATILIPVFWSF